MPETIARLSVTCPGCQARLRAHPRLVGRTVRCTKCAGAVPVPGPAPAARRPERRGADDDLPARNRPRRQAKRERALLIGLLAGLALLLVGGGAAAFLLLRSDDRPAPPAYLPDNAGPPRVDPVPPGPVPAPQPGDPAGGAIPPQGNAGPPVNPPPVEKGPGRWTADVEPGQKLTYLFHADGNKRMELRVTRERPTRVCAYVYDQAVLLASDTSDRDCLATWACAFDRTYRVELVNLGPGPNRLRVELTPGLPGAQLPAAPDPAAGGPPLLSVQGSLSPDSPRDPLQLRAPVRYGSHPVRLEGGRTYALDLEGKGFVPVLRLDEADGTGATVAADQNPTNAPRARIVYTAERTGMYRAFVTTPVPAFGRYTLTVRPQ